MNKMNRANLYNFVIVDDGKTKSFREIRSLDEINNYSVVGKCPDFTIHVNHAVILLSDINKPLLRMTRKTYDDLKCSYSAVNDKKPKTLRLISEIDNLLK